MNISLGKKQDLTSYRKIAIASWRHPRDPSTYTTLDLPIDAAMEFLRSYDTETPLTLTHYVAKIVAHCLDKYPELNHVLRAGNLYKRKQVDVFITTLLKTSKGSDLSGFVIRDVKRKTLREVADLCKSRVDDLRNNKDSESLKVRQVVDGVPTFLLRPLMLLQDFLQYTLNIFLPLPGMVKDQFGSVVITNVGALGIENAFIPLSPYSRCPLLVGIGKPRKVPLVRGDEVVPGDSVAITFTFDHRYADGAHGAYLARRFKKLFGNPSAFRSVFEAGVSDSTKKENHG